MGVARFSRLYLDTFIDLLVRSLRTEELNQFQKIEVICSVPTSYKALPDVQKDPFSDFTSWVNEIVDRASLGD